MLVSRRFARRSGGSRAVFWGVGGLGFRRFRGYGHSSGGLLPRVKPRLSPLASDIEPASMSPHRRHQHDEHDEQEQAQGHYQRE